jgi:hypothetical protein
MFGFKPYYKTITCVPAQETEFNGIWQIWRLI